jgi:nicotinamide mononucleotide transporter
MSTTLEKNIFSIVLGTVLTVLSYGIGMKFNWITELNWLEVFSVYTSYVCTILCVLQSRTNYIWGVVSVIALSVLFYQSNLYSSMVLNIYLIPTLIWGWFRWRSDEEPRPVTFVGKFWWPVYLFVTVSVWYVLIQISEYMGAVQAPMDSFILAASILAQFLLDQKKLENWIVWAIINVVAIKNYMDAGLALVAFQYVFFLLNTVWGFVMWNKTRKEFVNV